LKDVVKCLTQAIVTGRWKSLHRHVL